MIDAHPIVYPVARVILRACFGLLGGFRVEGAEHVPRKGGVLLAVNHLSYADPAALGVASPRRPWFMAKRPLFESRFLGGLLRLAHSFPVDQESVDRHAIRTALDLLERGEAVAIFPEGSTSPTGELMPFFPGFALIAIRSRAPVVPVGLIGTSRVLPYDKVVARFARGGVTVRFGEPLDVSTPPPDVSRREHMEWATEKVREAIGALVVARCRAQS